MLGALRYLTFMRLKKVIVCLVAVSAGVGGILAREKIQSTSAQSGRSVTVKLPPVRSIPKPGFSAWLLIDSPKASAFDP